MSDPYVPNHDPFHVTEDGYRVYEMSEGHYLVSNMSRPNTYRGDLKGVVRFIERERKN